MKHLMIDIETLGDKPDTVITEMAAVQFDPNTGETGGMISGVFDVPSQLEAGRSVDPETIQWWAEKGVKKETLLTQPGTDLKMFLERQFLAFLSMNFSNDENLYVWSRGVDFDLTKVKYANGWVQMWLFRHQRDLRTLEALWPSKMHEIGKHNTRHKPLFDCLNQIKILHNIWKHIKPEAE